jgi:hypothetical protein
MTEKQDQKMTVERDLGVEIYVCNTYNQADMDYYYRKEDGIKLYGSKELYEKRCAQLLAAYHKTEPYLKSLAESEEYRKKTAEHEEYKQKIQDFEDYRYKIAELKGYEQVTFIKKGLEKMNFRGTIPYAF